MIIIIVSLVIILPILYYAAMESSDLYIIDKGMILSYVDEYNFMHDSAYWLIVKNDEHTYTIFVNPCTWYNYTVGEIYLGNMSQYLTYEGNDGIARYLGDAQRVE